MKKFRFMIRKVLEKEIEIKGENEREAFKKVIELLGIGEQVLFKNLDKNSQVYEIKMTKAINENDENNKQNLKKILDGVIKQLEKDLQDYEENDTGIKDDLPREFSNIVCENCRNSIQLDEVL